MAVTADNVVVELEANTADFNGLADGVADRMVFHLDGCITPEEVAAIVREAASGGEAQRARQILLQSGPHLPPQATRRDAGSAPHVPPLELLSALLIGVIAGSLLTIAARPSQRFQEPAGSRSDDAQGWFRDLASQANLVRDPAWSDYLQRELAESSRNMAREIADAGRRIMEREGPSLFKAWRGA